MKAIGYSELREMSNEQVELLLNEAKTTLFRLRLQARMEKLDSPSELKKTKKLIARIKTLQTSRKAVNN